MPAVAASQQFDHGVVNQRFTPLDGPRSVGQYDYCLATASAKIHRYLRGETRFGILAHAASSSFWGSSVSNSSLFNPLSCHLMVMPLLRTVMRSTRVCRTLALENYVSARKIKHL